MLLVASRREDDDACILRHPALLEQPWARALADRPNVHVTADTDAIVTILRLQGPDDGPLVEA